MSEQWPKDVPVKRVRIARPTDRLEAIVAFYRDGIGLPVIDSFEGHAGYSGVMLGLPGASYHLEFTQRDDGSDGAAPSRDNLLVFYCDDRAAMGRIVERLGAMGYAPVAPENPYWSAIGAVTIEDPDAWRVVFAPLERSA